MRKTRHLQPLNRIVPQYVIRLETLIRILRGFRLFSRDSIYNEVLEVDILRQTTHI